MFEKPQQQHQWLEKMVGRWSFDSECVMGPDQPTFKATGEVVTRSLGGLWTISDCEASSGDGNGWHTVMTLGYDPKSQRFIGTFVGSMGSYLWIYSGTLDEAGRVLSLDTDGPKMDDSGLTKYVDSIELVSDDHWILRSKYLGDDGNWNSFMTAHHRRLA